MAPPRRRLQLWQWGALLMGLGAAPFLLACLGEVLGWTAPGSNDGCGLVALAVVLIPLGAVMFAVGCCLPRGRQGS